MNKRTCEEKLDAWIQGEVADSTWSAHLKQCDACAKEVAGYQKLFRVLVLDAEVEPPVQLDRAVRQSMKVQEEGSPQFAFALSLMFCAWISLFLGIFIVSDRLNWSSQTVTSIILALGIYTGISTIASLPLIWQRLHRIRLERI